MLLVLGCGAPSVRVGEARGSARAGPLVFEATSGVAAAAPPDSGLALRTSVAVRNAGPDTVRFSTGQCAVTLRVFASAARAGAVAWRPGPPPGGERVCFLYARLVELPPGARDTARDLMAEVPLGELARGAAPRGTYHLAADVELGAGVPGPGPAARVRVPAGTLVVGP